MIRNVLYVFFALTVLFGTLSESQVKIIRRGVPGKDGGSADDLVDLRELAAMVALTDGKLVVDNVFDKAMRPKGYDAVDIRQGDVILMVNGKRVKSAADLRQEYTSVPTGSSVKLGIQRNEKMLIVSFDKADPAKLPKRNIIIRHDDGSGSEDMMVVPHTGLIIASKGGKVYVDGILPDDSSAVKSSGVKEGDVVTTINGSPVTSFANFSAAYKEIPVGKDVTITTSRKGKTGSFSFKKADGGQQRVIKRER
jgi:S1-C subfamily serine protease